MPQGNVISIYFLDGMRSLTVNQEFTLIVNMVSLQKWFFFCILYYITDHQQWRIQDFPDGERQLPKRVP